MIRYGFTGTQYGATPSQLGVAEALLTIFRMGDERPVLNHGSCVGADFQVHNIALRLGYRLRLFPSNIPNKIAPCEGWETIEDQKPPLVRNSNIVEVSDRMIAIPREEVEVSRSGTWYTIRLARKMLRPIVIIFPKGQLKFEHWPQNW